MDWTYGLHVQHVSRQTDFLLSGCPKWTEETLSAKLRPPLEVPCQAGRMRICNILCWMGTGGRKSCTTEQQIHKSDLLHVSNSKLQLRKDRQSKVTLLSPHCPNNGNPKLASSAIAGCSSCLSEHSRSKWQLVSSNYKLPDWNVWVA